MIETTVSQRRELASERLLKESDDQRAEREVCVVVKPRQWLPVTHDRAGQRRSPSIHPIRGYRNPSTFLLHSVRETVQERCSVRRTLQFLCPPPQNPVQGDAIELTSEG